MTESQAATIEAKSEQRGDGMMKISVVKELGEWRVRLQIGDWVFDLRPQFFTEGGAKPFADQFRQAMATYRDEETAELRELVRGLTFWLEALLHKTRSDLYDDVLGTIEQLIDKGKDATKP